MSVTAIIQTHGAADSSGGPLVEIDGRALLACQVERLQYAKRIGPVVVATSDSAEDSTLPGLAANLGVPCVRGPADAPTTAFVRAVTEFPANHILYLTDDRPLLDPGLVDALVDFHIDGGFDHSSLAPGFPAGLGGDIMTLWTLQTVVGRMESAASEADLRAYLRDNPDGLRQGTLPPAQDYSRHVWAVDGPVKVEFARRVFRTLGRHKPDFTWRDVLAFIEDDQDPPVNPKTRVAG